MAVMRYDVQRQKLGKTSYTGAGALRVPGWVARTGVQTYYDDQGNPVREYRSPEEVEKSLTTLASVPVTVDHQGLVAPQDWQTKAVGWVSDRDPTLEDGGSEGKFVSTELVVQDGSTIQRILDRELVELSCGYTCESLALPGVAPNGEHYDRIQTNIRANHVALLPPGEARAGSQAALRLDSVTGDLVAVTTKEPPIMTEAEIKALTDRVAALEAERDAAVAAKDALEAESARQDAAFPKLVQDAVDLRTKAGKALGAEYDYSNKSAHQVRRDALAKLGVTLRADKADSEAYVEAYFDAELAKLNAAPAAPAAPPPAVVVVTDSKGPPADDPDGRKLALAKLAAAYKGAA